MMNRHPLAIAWDEWLASTEGQEACNPSTLARYTNTYLENRLHRAFDAGAKAVTVDTAQLARLRALVTDSIESYLTLAKQLDQWAQESVDGGWSTHQVGPMRVEASRLRSIVKGLRAALAGEGE
jgi:hypothetical protein